MGWRAGPDCQHLDNFGRCRVHLAPRLLRWLLPKGRLVCVFLDGIQPQDGVIVCHDQKEFPRPAGPPPRARND